MDVTVRRVDAPATRPLRLEVLRPGRPAETALFPGDEDPSAVHFAAVAADGTIVGVTSLYEEARADGPSPAWRLRGMATAPSVRGLGVGGALVGACVDHVAAAGGGELWCNARVVASGFYARHGFEVVSNRFEVEGIGLHEVMRREIPPAAAVACGDGRP